MTDIDDLSPAADAVVFAFNAEHSGWVQDPQFLPAIAAALLALADQVVPEEPAPPSDLPMHEMIENPMDSIEHVTAVLQRQETRRQILAIAAELTP